MKTEKCNSKQIQPFYFTFIFLICGTSLGISLGVVYENIPIGMSIGPGAGLFIGTLFDRLYKKKQTPKECK
jgi:hypothetical protein